MFRHKKYQIPPDLVVKSQPADIVDIVLQLIRRPNGAHRACHSRKSRGEPFSTSEVQWSTTKSDGVCLFAMEHHRQHCKHRLDEHAIFPRAARTQCEVGWSPLGGMETG